MLYDISFGDGGEAFGFVFKIMHGLFQVFRNLPYMQKSDHLYFKHISSFQFIKKGP